MKGTTVIKQFVLALVLTGLSLPLIALARVLGVPTLPFMFSAVTVGYLATVIVQSWNKPGKCALIGSVASVCVVAFLGSGTLSAFVAVLAVTVWFVRSFVSYERMSGWLFDGALVYLGLVLASWVLGTTGAIFLALWTFLLIQALYPLALGERATVTSGSDTFGRFERSARAAEEALRRVVAVRG